MKNTPAYTNQLEIGRWLMACRFEVLLNAGQVPHGPDAALEALDIAEHLELLLSVYKPESEFSRINASIANHPTRVSAYTADLIRIAADVKSKTDRAFDLAAASLSELWGFSRRGGRMPVKAEIEAAVEVIANSTLNFDEATSSITRNSDQLKINSGGIGKGYALDRMALSLKGNGVHDFLIHGGHSSISAAGDRLDIDSNSGWRVAVSHPLHSRQILGELKLSNNALGTSGSANQFFYFDGCRYSHVIDPRTGWPVSSTGSNGLLSITVLHPSAAVADALATAFFILGIDASNSYCHQHSETSFIAVHATEATRECRRNLL